MPEMWGMETLTDTVEVYGARMPEGGPIYGGCEVDSYTQLSIAVYEYLEGYSSDSEEIERLHDRLMSRAAAAADKLRAQEVLYNAEA